MGRKKDVEAFEYVSFVCKGDDTPVRWELLSEQEKTELSAKMMSSISENLNSYINAYPEEINFLIKN